jgi:Spy/CpxP family protein refolding chaperone
MNGNRGLIIAIAASFIVGCSAGLMGGIVFVHFMGHGRGARFDSFGMRGGPPPFMGHGGSRGPTRDERMLPYLARELDLTAAQQQRMKELIDRARHEHEAVRESMEVRVAQELTPAQRARWKELEQRMGMRRHGPDRDGPPPEAPPDRR